MAKVKEVLALLDAHAPFRFAEPWDQCGLQVGDPEADVKRILVALDPGSAALDEAIANGCQCLVTHHPLIFRPLQRVRTDEYPGALVVRALREGINLIAAHTNLDVAREGTNDCLAGVLELQCVTALEEEKAWHGEGRYGGMGRLGLLPDSVTLGDLATRLGRLLPSAVVRGVGDQARPVQRVALCTGSGGSLVERAIATGADVYVSGDIKYHEAQRAVEAGLGIVDVGHFASEHLVLQPLAQVLRSWAEQLGLPLAIRVARTERDPFWTLNGENI